MLKPTNTVLLIGKRGSGKSILMRDLAYRLHQTGQVDFAAGFSPTEDTQGSFGQFLPSTAIHEDYDEGVVSDIMRAQKKQWRRGHGSNMVLFMDDIMYNKSVLKTKVIRELFLNGRHRHVGLVLAAQYCMDLGPELRSNLDVVICCRESIKSNREKLYKNFFGLFGTYEEFSRTMDATTSNYECLVLINNVASNDISKCIFWYKADPDVPQFRIGCERFWRMHRNYMVEEGEAAECNTVRETGQTIGGAAPTIAEVTKDDEDFF